MRAGKDIAKKCLETAV